MSLSFPVQFSSVSHKISKQKNKYIVSSNRAKQSKSNKLSKVTVIRNLDKFEDNPPGKKICYSLNGINSLNAINIVRNGFKNQNVSILNKVTIIFII